MAKSKVDLAFYKSIGDELIARLHRLGNFTRHSGSIGYYHEEILRAPIRDLLSERFSLRTGFAYADRDAVSRQGDIIIVDENEPSPYLFKQGDFVVVEPRAVVCVIEVKTKLKKRDFLESVLNIHSFRQTGVAARSGYIGGLIFSYDSVLFNPKTLADWYKAVTVPDHLASYADAVFSLQQGFLMLDFDKGSKTCGHRVLLGEEPGKPMSKGLSIFLALIRKYTLRGQRDRNPFGLADFSNLRWSKERHRYGFGVEKFD